MPNGLNVSKESETWRRLEAPLLEADPVLKSFADESGLHFGGNVRNWPGRGIFWSSRGLRRGIRIDLSDSRLQTYSVYAWATAGVGMTYKSKKVFLKQGVGWPEIAPELGDLLVRAFNMAEQWSEEDLDTSGRFDWGAYYRNRFR
jgi:hypothetical protein